MARKENRERKKADKVSQEEKKPFMSDRQKSVLLILIIASFIAVPLVQIIRCKSACMKRVKTPYPEIACRYECPWPWQKSE